VRLLLVPWSKLFSFGLRIYRLPLPEYINEHKVDIGPVVAQRIALSLLDRYAKEKKLTASFPLARERMGVEIEISDDIIDKLLRILSALSRLEAKTLRKGVFRELLEKQLLGLEEVERALALQELISP
jgi:hypothetical protein